MYDKIHYKLKKKKKKKHQVYIIVPGPAVATSGLFSQSPLPFCWMIMFVSQKCAYCIFHLGHEWKGKVKVKVARSCLTLCNPMDYTVHGILQATILEWVAFPFSRRSSPPRNPTRVSCVAGGLFTELSGKPRPWISIFKVLDMLKVP